MASFSYGRVEHMAVLPLKLGAEVADDCQAAGEVLDKRTRSLMATSGLSYAEAFKAVRQAPENELLLATYADPLAGMPTRTATDEEAKAALDAADPLRGYGRPALVHAPATPLGRDDPDLAKKVWAEVQTQRRAGKNVSFSALWARMGGAA